MTAGNAAMIIVVLLVVFGTAATAAIRFAMWMTAKDDGWLDESGGHRNNDHYTGWQFKAYLSGIAQYRREQAIRESRKDVTY